MLRFPTKVIKTNKQASKQQATSTCKLEFSISAHKTREALSLPTPVFLQPWAYIGPYGHKIASKFVTVRSSV